MTAPHVLDVGIVSWAEIRALYKTVPHLALLATPEHGPVPPGKGVEELSMRCILLGLRDLGTGLVTAAESGPYCRACEGRSQRCFTCARCNGRRWIPWSEVK